MEYSSSLRYLCAEERKLLAVGCSAAVPGEGRKIAAMRATAGRCCSCCLLRRRRRRRRRRQQHLLICVMAAVVVLALYSVASFSAEASYSDGRNNISNTTAASSTSGPYEWESFDYYRILNLDDSSAVTPEEVRKAYRHQAKRYHPDKQLLHANNNSKDGKQQQPATTKEEANARFARISEAYQVLSDPEKRREYDAYLKRKEYYQSHGGGGGGIAGGGGPGYGDYNDAYFGNEPPYESGGWDGYADADQAYYTWSFDDMVADPFQMFEDVFTEFFDPFQSYFDEADLLYGGGSTSAMNNRQQHQHMANEPIRVTQEEQAWYDEQSDQEYTRIVQTQEFYDGRYQILAQDFEEVWDPYRHTWVYQPLQQEPVLVDEGYRNGGSAGTGAGDGSSGRSREETKQQQREFGEVLVQERSVLWPSEILTGNEALQNPPYHAGLTSNCELWIVEDRAGVAGEPVEVLWSSYPPSMSKNIDDDDDEPIPPPLFGGNCRLELRGSHLVVRYQVGVLSITADNT